jgi:hypothetical protein
VALDPNAVRARIENEYRTRGDGFGWRLLASPWETVHCAEVAFIGLQPGGSAEAEDHPDLCPEIGSAYVTESWAGAPSGQSRLQKQVRALFAMLNVEPEAVLAGNLVPFRSPSAAKFNDMKSAIGFGEDLWAQLLAEAKPELVITMAADTTRALQRIGGIREMQSCTCGWGSVRIRYGAGPRFRLVGLPHLSRFGIVTRAESQAALHEAFDLG